jgi:hypothetical protein
MSGRVLIRFLKAAQEMDSKDQILTLRTELEFVQCVQSVLFVVAINLFKVFCRLAISKVGEQIPLACRFLLIIIVTPRSDRGSKLCTQSCCIMQRLIPAAHQLV